MKNRRIINKSEGKKRGKNEKIKIKCQTLRNKSKIRKKNERTVGRKTRNSIWEQECYPVRDFSNNQYIPNATQSIRTKIVVSLAFPLASNNDATIHPTHTPPSQNVRYRFGSSQ